MQFRYPLSPELTAKAQSLDEFANGAAQCHVRLVSGVVHPGVLISNAAAIIAMRDQSQLPFSVAEITELFQADDDSAPRDRGGWHYFDRWGI